VITAFFALLLPAPPQAPFELMEGDRVVFVGNTFVERDLAHNYLEAALTARFPERNVTFRNIGWSGDTVFGHARAGFGSAEDGFRYLGKHLAELKPTVVFLAYGLNESFEGERGLPGFEKGLARLLETVAALAPRATFLVSPIRHENLGPPLPDPAESNRNLRLYVDAMKKTAEARRLGFVDLFERLGAGSQEAPLTDNGIHLNARGYRRAARTILEALGIRPDAHEVTVQGPGPITATLPAGESVLTLRGLKAGRYALKAGGLTLASASAEEWSRGVAVEPSEKLREAIAAKNFLYFNRWRPQNETYIFGFRKREQGHLAPEIPQFDPLVEAKEKEIAKLRVPQSQSFALEAVK